MDAIIKKVRIADGLAGLPGLRPLAADSGIRMAAKAKK